MTLKLLSLDKLKFQSDLAKLPLVSAELSCVMIYQWNPAATG